MGKILRKSRMKGIVCKQCGNITYKIYCDVCKKDISKSKRCIALSIHKEPALNSKDYALCSNECFKKTLKKIILKLDRG